MLRLPLPRTPPPGVGHPQLLARYETWLDTMAAPTATPSPDVDMVAAVYADVTTLAALVEHDLFDRAIVPHLPVSPAGVGVHRNALHVAVARLLDRQPGLLATAVHVLSARCGEPIAAVRTITTLYRMTNREVGPVARARCDGRRTHWMSAYLGPHERTAPTRRGPRARAAPPPPPP